MERVSGLSFSYVSYRRVGEELTGFLNYDVVYDGGHEVGKPYQTMIGFGMEAVMGALDVSFTPGWQARPGTGGAGAA